MPQPTAAADPLLLPPGVRARSRDCAFLGGGRSFLLSTAASALPLPALAQPAKHRTLTVTPLDRFPARPAMRVGEKNRVVLRGWQSSGGTLSTSCRVERNLIVTHSRRGIWRVSIADPIIMMPAVANTRMAARIVKAGQR